VNHAVEADGEGTGGSTAGSLLFPPSAVSDLTQFSQKWQGVREVGVDLWKKWSPHSPFRNGKLTTSVPASGLSPVSGQRRGASWSGGAFQTFVAAETKLFSPTGRPRLCGTAGGDLLRRRVATMANKLTRPILLSVRDQASITEIRGPQGPLPCWTAARAARSGSGVFSPA